MSFEKKYVLMLRLGYEDHRRSVINLRVTDRDSARSIESLVAIHARSNALTQTILLRTSII
jgi:hypothetical protein